MDAPSLEAFKARLDVALGSLVCWLATLHVAGGWNQMITVVLFNPGRSMILKFNQVPRLVCPWRGDERAGRSELHAGDTLVCFLCRAYEVDALNSVRTSPWLLAPGNNPH